MARRIAVLVFMLLVPFRAPLISQSSPLNANDVMLRVIEKLTENDVKKGATLTYRAHHIARRVKDNGDVEQIEETLEFRHNKPHILSRTINGRPDSSRPKGLEMRLREIFATKYEYTFLSSEPIPINGKKCLIIEFHPKQGLAFETKEDQILNRARGKIFIDHETLLVWRFEAWLPEEFSIYTYFRVYSANIAITFQEVGDVVTEQLITMNSYYKNGWFASAKTLTETYTFTEFDRLP